MLEAEIYAVATDTTQVAISLEPLPATLALSARGKRQAWNISAGAHAIPKLEPNQGVRQHAKGQMDPPSRTTVAAKRTPI